MSAGLRHIDVGPELTRSEWEGADTHELAHGNSFPVGPVERQLFYRDDLHAWFIYHGSAWVSLQAPVFVPLSTTEEIWRRGDSGSSPFTAEIDGSPSNTEVVYDNEENEYSLPDPAGFPQWGKVILHNITRGSSRRIVGVNLATKTITTETSTDNWNDGDVITIGSQTCVDVLPGHDYSRFFDIDLSEEVPATATTALIELYNCKAGAAVTSWQNNVILHPYHAHSGANERWTTSFPQDWMGIYTFTVSVVEQRICLALSRLHASTLVLLRLRGYWE